MIGRISLWTSFCSRNSKVKKTFGLFLVKLVTAKGRVLLDQLETLKIAGLQDGDCLTALSLQATGRILATLLKFLVSLGVKLW
jgi:hypothetical protein